MSRITEKQRRSWFFALLTLIWVGATVFIVQEMTPKSSLNTEERLFRLNKYDQNLDDLENLVLQMESSFAEIKATRFEIYQDYYVYELLDKIKGLHDESKPISQHTARVSTVLKLLLYARKELVTKKRNIETTAEAVQNCQEGNQYIQPE